MPKWRLSLPFALLALILLLPLQAAGASHTVRAAQAAPNILGDWDIVAVSSGGGTYPQVWVVTSQSSGSWKGNVAGNPSYTLEGTVSSGAWTMISHSGGYSSTAKMTLSEENGVLKTQGTWSDTNGNKGTLTGTHKTQAKPKLMVSAKANVPIASSGDAEVALGQHFTVTVRVTAKGGDFKDVYLQHGTLYAAAGEVRLKSHAPYCPRNPFVLTQTPASASGFPLADGQTRVFTFTLRAHRYGAAHVEGTFIGSTDSGQVKASGKTRSLIFVPNPNDRGGNPVETGPGCFTMAISANQVH